MISHDVIGTKRPASRDRFGGAVRQAHHMREIERLTATNHHRQHMNPHKSSKAFPQDHARTVESEQIFSLQCQTEQAARQMANHKSFFERLWCFKHILSTANQEGWWSRTGSNRRHPACKAGALPAELRPLIPIERKWWAWEDLNLRPHAYQARALTN